MEWRVPLGKKGQRRALSPCFYFVDQEKRKQQKRNVPAGYTALRERRRGEIGNTDKKEKKSQGHRLPFFRRGGEHARYFLETKRGNKEKRLQDFTIERKRERKLKVTQKRGVEKEGF